jgi:uncharacterized protein (UPF0254 family)
MLFIFIVAFIVTLIAAGYMQFGSQAERYVLQYRLHADVVVIFGTSTMFMLCLNGLRDSGVSNNTGLALLFFSWIPAALAGVRIEKIQDSFNDLYKVGMELNSKRTKHGFAEMQAVLFFMEMQRIQEGQKNRVHRALLAHKRYHQYCK